MENLIELNNYKKSNIVLEGQVLIYLTSVMIKRIVLPEVQTILEYLVGETHIKELLKSREKRLKSMIFKFHNFRH